MPTQGTSISSSTFNIAQAKLQDILGIGENGYGLPYILSDPISFTNQITSQGWNFFLHDVNTIHRHITNQSTSSYVTLSTSTVLYASTVNNVFSNIDWLYDDTRRYTCHPSQFFTTGTNALPTTSTFTYGGVSTRTTTWGIDPTSLSHEVVATFPTRLRANYYFNLGSFLTFNPFVSGTTYSDLDTRWSSFVNYINENSRKYKYDRAKFQYNSTLTTFTSGTLSVSVLAEKINVGKSIKFSIAFSDSENTNVYINPTGNSWKILV